MALGEEELTAVSVLIALGLRRGEAEAMVKKLKARGIKESDELVQTALRERGRKAAEVVR
jgi:Holliday junction resolvasome RuvABC DNA-binding subunit